jgi:hypothetical protein
MLGHLLRFRRPGGDCVHREAPELLFPGLPAPEHEPTAVLAEVEVGYPFLGIGDAPGLAAVGPHEVELALVLPGRSVPVRGEDEEAPVPRPPGGVLVLLVGEGHLPAGRRSPLHRHQVDVRLTGGLLPIRGGDGIEHPLPVGAHGPGSRPGHELHVQEGHGAKPFLRSRLGSKALAEAESRDEEEGEEEGDGEAAPAETGMQIAWPPRR